MTNVSREISWVNFLREPMIHNANLYNAESVYNKALEGKVPDINDLPLPNDKEFVAGQLHNHVADWKIILENSPIKSEIID